MTKVLVIHGAGMNMRGKTQVEIFGPMTLSQYDQKIKEYASEIGVEVEIYHSNIEGEVINKLYEADEGGVNAALINPAGYTRGYLALAMAIGQVTFPVIELHISNLASRGVGSDISPVCRGVIAGCGLFGYYLGLIAVKHIIEQE